MSSYCRSNLFRQIFLSVLFLLTFSSYALTSKTSNVIYGSAPYLTLDHGLTKVMTSEALLGITLENGQQYIAPGSTANLYPNAIVDYSSQSNPITLPNGSNQFSSVKTLVPITGNNNYPKINLSNLIGSPYNYWQDDDGDSDISATGSLTVKWQDVVGNDITSVVKHNPSQKLSACDAPYKLTVTATNGQLSTQYGHPKSSTFRNGYHVYYLNPTIDRPNVCYAQPNLNGTGGDELSSQWNAMKGFKVQNINSPEVNFPTTGFNGAVFYLLLGGISPEQVISANGSTIYPTNGRSNVSLALSSTVTPRWGSYSSIHKGGDIALRVELRGPTINSSNPQFNPSVFKIYSDSSRRNILYTFKIQRWFIVKPYGFGGRYRAEDYCAGFSGYRLPSLRDYNNANGQGWTGGIPGRTDRSGRREISYKNYNNEWVGGLSNEWGYLIKDVDRSPQYPNAEWEFERYWVKEIKYSNRPYIAVNSPFEAGAVYYNDWDDRSPRVSCVSP